MVVITVQPAQMKHLGRAEFLFNELWAAIIVKRSTIIDEQISLLRNRGMTIYDDSFTRQWPTSVGYYRLSG